MIIYSTETANGPPEDIREPGNRLRRRPDGGEPLAGYVGRLRGDTGPPPLNLLP
jgi:hypothetical protein